MDRKYTVYEHVSEDGKRYIGITSQKLSVRWRHGNGYSKNKHFFRSIQKYGWDSFQHNVIAENVSEEEAKEIEIRLIKEYKTTDPKYGYNTTRGGDTRQPCPEEVKQKIREKNIGRKRSDETRKKLSEAAKKRDWGPLTDEHKKKISKSLMGNKRALGKHNNTKMVAMCDMNNEIIKTFISAVEAGKALNIDSSGISCACRENLNINGLGKTKYGGVYGGYKWFYLDKTMNIINNNTGRKINKRNSPILQCDLQRNVVNHFEKIKDAAAANGLSKNGLCFALKNKQEVSYKGFLWVREI